MNAKAEYRIIIEPGFLVNAGSIFRASIYPGSDYNGGKHSPLFINDEKNDYSYNTIPVSFTEQNLQREENQNKAINLYPNPNSGTFL